MPFIKNDEDRIVFFEKKGFRSHRMKLFYLGEKVNNRKEQNIESEGLEFGFCVEIKYKRDSWNYKYIQKAVLHNCTQVHYGYTEMGTIQPLTKIAFESDIHSTGFSGEIKDIESVNIKIENKRHKEYRE